MPRKEWRFQGEPAFKQKAFDGDCDSIRRQIAQLVGSKTMTKAAFLRQCGALIGLETVK